MKVPQKMFSIITFVVVFALGACFSPWKGEEASLVISLGGGSRAAFTQAQVELFVHTVRVSGGPGQVREVTGVTYGSAVSFTVMPGRWTITAEALLDGKLMATGSVTQTINAGSNTVTISMTAVDIPDDPLPPGTEAGLYREITEEQYELILDNNGAAIDPHDLTAVFEYVNANPGEGPYVLVIGQDIHPGDSAFGLESPVGLTIAGVGEERNIFMEGSDGLFYVAPADGTGPSSLTLGKNITLRGGGQDFSPSLVGVHAGGVFLMEEGSKIAGASSNGGVYVGGGTFTMNGGAITGNTAGSGVYMDDGDFTMSGGSISGNEASAGGGVYVAGGTFTVTGTAGISGNKAPAGGGVYVAGGSFIMSGGTISNNTAEYTGTETTGRAMGGGVYIESTNGEHAVTISGGSIAGNTAVNRKNGGGVAQGGGVCVIRYGGSIAFNFSKGNISGNHVEGGGGTIGGGGIFIDQNALDGNTFLTMSGGSIDGNTVTAASGLASGGGVYYADMETGVFTMSGGTIASNKLISEGGAWGGGVYINRDFIMTGGSLSGNSAAGKQTHMVYGGGVYITEPGSFIKSGSGGTITGIDDVDLADRNIAGSDTALKTGHAVYIPAAGSNLVKWRDITAGPEDGLDSGSMDNWESEIRIRTIADLEAIDDNATTLAGSYVLDVDNLDLSGSPYNERSVINATFTGKFDGAGKTISGLTVTTATTGAGLFREIAAGAEVKDLNLSVNSVNATGNFRASGIAAINRGTIKNCHVTVASGGSISALNTGNYVRAGGIAGENYSVIENCSVEGNIKSGGNYAGGIVGYNNGTNTNSRGQIRDCSFTGNVEAAAEGSGGIAGNNWGLIENCSTEGDITSGTTRAGGITGYNWNDGEIRNCSYKGVVKAVGNTVGGIAGDNAGAIENCYAANGKAIAGVSYVGGIAGWHAQNKNIANCVALFETLEWTIDPENTEYHRIVTAGFGRLRGNYGLLGMRKDSDASILIVTDPDDLNEGVDPNQQNGADVTLTQANDENWWKSAATWNTVDGTAWDFSDTGPWTWDEDTDLPALKRSY